MIAHRHAGAHGVVDGHCHVELTGAVWILHHIIHLGEGESPLQ